MAKKINVVYFDNTNFDFYGYKEWFMEINDIRDDEEVTDDDVYKFIDEQFEEIYDYFFTNLMCSENDDNYCVITGRLGLWNGTPQIEPCVCPSMTDAIKKCLYGMDNAIIKQVNGHLEVVGIHHDGRNCFEIHLLNNKGIDAYDRITEGRGRANLNDRRYHKSLGGYLF